MERNCAYSAAGNGYMQQGHPETNRDMSGNLLLPLRQLEMGAISPGVIDLELTTGPEARRSDENLQRWITETFTGYSCSQGACSPRGVCDMTVIGEQHKPQYLEKKNMNLIENI